MQEAERLQQLVEQEQAEVSQLQEANKDLEAAIEVQEQVKETTVRNIKK